MSFNPDNPLRLVCRTCVHFRGGVTQPDDVNRCAAFPEGIPDDVLYGEWPHFDDVHPDQQGTLLWEGDTAKVPDTTWCGRSSTPDGFKEATLDVWQAVME